MMKAKYLIALAMLAGSLGSCSDMLENDSARREYDPALDSKTDSMFYTLGALKAVQQATDQYVLANEVRGDLSALTSHASTDLQELSKFNVTASNKYDSAYVYYRIINNCNYYIAHRDSNLSTGANMVAEKEIAEAHALRAWAYLQLGRTYERVPFYTEPLMDVASIENVANQPTKTLAEIVATLAPELEKYADQPVPSWGSFTDTDGGKTVETSQMMVPVSLVLGDMYLEVNDYSNAAKKYFNYLKAQEVTAKLYQSSYMNYPDLNNLPTALRRGNATTDASDDYSISSVYTWSAMFNSSSYDEIITTVPFATNKLRGTVSELPSLFGYNYYATSDDKQYNEELSITASNAYKSLAQGQNFYYSQMNKAAGASAAEQGYSNQLGDMRYYVTLMEPSALTSSSSGIDTTFYYVSKFQNANVHLYRVAGVYLKLAEAINRLGHPDVAFAVLKDGITTDLRNDSTYMTEEGYDFLTSGEAPFLGSATNINIFNGVLSSSSTSDVTGMGNQPIHSRGCGHTKGIKSLYKFSTEVEKKLDELVGEASLGVVIGETKNDTLMAQIEAVEDLLCDEMALELAFEGSRFNDLCRIARHKNQSAVWGADYGWKWLDYKLKGKNLGFSFVSEPSRIYLPFQ